MSRDSLQISHTDTDNSIIKFSLYSSVSVVQTQLLLKFSNLADDFEYQLDLSTLEISSNCLIRKLSSAHQQSYFSNQHNE